MSVKPTDAGPRLRVRARPGELSPSGPGGVRSPSAATRRTAILAAVAARYEIATRTRRGAERLRPYVSDTELEPGDLVALDGRLWLVERLDGARAIAKPARYRIVLRHPDGRREVGAFRRFRSGGPHLGHVFATVEDGAPAAWEIVDRRLAYDDAGEPYVELVAERDFSEVESLPSHELEHVLDERGADLSEGAAAALERAHEAGLSAELVALEAGAEPDWEEAERYLDALVLEAIEDDLLEQCGVDPDADPPETWLDTVKERLRADLTSFRADIEGDHDQIEEWDFRGGRIFASVGSFDDEWSPLAGHGWMCRLVDSGVLAAAGFARVHKRSFVPD